MHAAIGAVRGYSAALGSTGSVWGKHIERRHLFVECIVLYAGVHGDIDIRPSIVTRCLGCHCRQAVVY